MSDFYPNVKYKVDLIKGMESITTHAYLYDLGGGGFYSNLGKFSFIKTMLSCLKLVVGTLSVYFRFLLNKTDFVYVVYPAPLLILLLSLIPRSLRPFIYMDAFISLYDTAVYDRKMIRGDSLRGKLLFWLEQHAISVSNSVFVDTFENANFYAYLFSTDVTKFEVIPLSIPPLLVVNKVDAPDKSKFICLFIGSLVPLQGISKILEAAKELAHIAGLEFLIIGDGQEGSKIEEFLRVEPIKNLIWKKGMYPTEYIISAISSADLCLGIFGESNKTQRVLPYKIYYYASLSKPFVTLATPCLKNLCTDTEDLFLSEAERDSPKSLASLILSFYEDREKLKRCAIASGNWYSKTLSSEVIRQKLSHAFHTDF